MAKLEDVIAILEQIKPGYDYKEEQDLVQKHILVSLNIITLVSELEDAFDISISAMDVVPENFSSAQTILALVQRLQGE